MNQNKGSGLFALLPSRWSVFHLAYIQVEVDLSARLVAAQPEGVPEVGLPSLVIPVAQNRQHTQTQVERSKEEPVDVSFCLP